jgi:hypothetical protein
MINYIENMREAPDKKKKQHALAITSAVMLLIIGIWAFTLPARFSKDSALSNAAAALEAAPASDGSVSPNQFNASISNSDSSNSSTYSSNGVIITDPNTTKAPPQDGFTFDN